MGQPKLRDLQSRPLGGVPVLRARPLQAADSLLRSIGDSDQRPVGVHLINAYSIALARREADYRAVLQHSGLNFPDGKPLMWVTRASRTRLHQVRGPGFFRDVLDRGRAQNVRHFLLGGSQELLVKLEANLRDELPGVNIVGVFSPPFRSLTDEEYAAQDEMIRHSGADIVWVGLGTPKQDFEVNRIARSLPVIACAVGAAFDFAAGTKAEAPRWMTALGVEWVFRLASEPRRLWRRYLFGNLGFIAAVLTSRGHRA